MLYKSFISCPNEHGRWSERGCTTEERRGEERAWLHRRGRERQLPIRVVAAEVSILCFYHCNYFINFYSTNLLSLALTITVKEASVAAPPREGDAVAHLNCCRGGEYFIFYHCNYFTNFYSTNILSLAFHDGVTRMERTTGRGRWHHEDAEEMRGRLDEDNRTRMTGQGCRGDERTTGRRRWRHEDGHDGITRMERMASRGWRGEER